jgi:PAS domain-containing protein
VRLRQQGEPHGLTLHGNGRSQPPDGGSRLLPAAAPVPHGRTGELRWAQATAVPDARDDSGRPQRVYVMFTDVTEQRRMASALVGERAARAGADPERADDVCLLAARLTG